jgi:hypothetical protein
MAGNMTGKEQPVTMNCDRCGQSFSQAWGFVTVRRCTSCMVTVAAWFWEIFNGKDSHNG